MLYVYPYYYYVALMNNQALWDLIVSTYISMWDVLFIFWSFPLPLSRGFSVPVILAYVMLSSVKCKVTMDTQIADNQNFDFGKRWCLVLAISRIGFFFFFYRSSCVPLISPLLFFRRCLWLTLGLAALFSHYHWNSKPNAFPHHRVFHRASIINLTQCITQ